MFHPLNQYSSDEFVIVLLSPSLIVLIVVSKRAPTDRRSRDESCDVVVETTPEMSRCNAIESPLSHNYHSVRYLHRGRGKPHLHFRIALRVELMLTQLDESQLKYVYPESCCTLARWLNVHGLAGEHGPLSPPFHKDRTTVIHL